MNRSIVGFPILTTVLLVWLALMQRSPESTQPEAIPTGFQPFDPETTKEETKPEAPPAPKLPLVLKRWSLPAGQKPPDKEAGTTVLIEPTGPWVINQSKKGAVYWNATTGEVRRMPRVEDTGPTFYIDQKRGYMVRDPRTGRDILNLKHSRALRMVCWTPDGCRLITASKPSMYPAHTVIAIPSGNSREYPARPCENIELYEILSGDRLGHFAPKNCNLDDDIWAVCAAPDGQSFFMMSTRELVQVNFKLAFDTKPLRPAR